MLLATKNCYEDAIKVLLDRGSDINTVDESESTPLHLAAEEDKLNIVQLLLDHGADINATDEFKSTPLHLAAEPWKAAKSTLLNFFWRFTKQKSMRVI